MSLDDSCRKEANIILTEESGEGEDGVDQQPRCPHGAGDAGHEAAIRVTSERGYYHESKLRQCIRADELNAQKSNEGDPVAKMLFEDEEIFSDNQHAAANKHDWLICLEGMIDNLTKALKDDCLPQSADHQVEVDRHEGA